MESESTSARLLSQAAGHYTAPVLLFVQRSCLSCPRSLAASYRQGSPPLALEAEQRRARLVLLPAPGPRVATGGGVPVPSKSLVMILLSLRVAGSARAPRAAAAEAAALGLLARETLAVITEHGRADC